MDQGPDKVRSEPPQFILDHGNSCMMSIIDKLIRSDKNISPSTTLMFIQQHGGAERVPRLWKDMLHSCSPGLMGAVPIVTTMEWGEREVALTVRRRVVQSEG